jgi:hypothetical protein
LKKTYDIIDAKELYRVFLDASVGAFQHINFFTNYNLKLLVNNMGLRLIFPFKLALIKPLSIKSFIRPFYRYYFGTKFFLMKAENN